MSVPELKEAIGDRLDHIRQAVPESVRLIAVSKQVSVEAMRVAYEAGVRDFAESRIQEATVKQEQLQDLTDITWHFIGHLQSNKAAKAIAQFQWIHSVDNLKLAQRLDRLAAELNQSPQICLQVKIVPDANKSGWAVPALLADLPALDACQHLKIVGLMTIPPYGLAPSDTLSIFQRTHDLADQIRQQTWSNLQIDQLSMGMSDDYPLAIQAGSTMIRLGRILFGERS
ncbi:YggS family pyridoxal phosphate-dependent enzyme [Oscillatoria sp. FACHB-1407]|uniref:YggS family pyridoxal phosphate-dependent enzyme n=1 Tax=Oscillatoria sp. FACHB-1407 TaxID=2692847 RepID=UPI0016821BB1|nr:YggS family pyridoxal phosphate-dependent enzyme [Oscillatoria sp. FACHB-1407]MBD2462964.1 YggS family pyridoxal phosphate-dependent enzyme [Oscillatoria sp. FACHB-1407]